MITEVDKKANIATSLVDKEKNSVATWNDTVFAWDSVEVTWTGFPV